MKRFVFIIVFNLLQFSLFAQTQIQNPNNPQPSTPANPHPPVTPQPSTPAQPPQPVNPPNTRPAPHPNNNRTDSIDFRSRRSNTDSSSWRNRNSRDSMHYRGNRPHPETAPVDDRNPKRPKMKVDTNEIGH